MSEEQRDRDPERARRMETLIHILKLRIALGPWASLPPIGALLLGDRVMAHRARYVVQKE